MGNANPACIISDAFIPSRKWSDTSLYMHTAATAATAAVDRTGRHGGLGGQHARM